MKLFLAAAAVFWLWADSARAEDRVLLLDSEAAARPGLLAALRIQLTGAAAVEVRHELPPGDSAARIAYATELSRRENALLVVWAEGPTPLPYGGQEAVLYAAGRREGRALLEVVRVPGQRGPDMDRTLALKVSEVVSELKAAERAGAEAGAIGGAGIAGAPAAGHAGESATQPAAALHDAEPIEEEEPAPWQWRPNLGAGVLAAPQARTDAGQWSAQLHAGVGLRSEPWQLGARLGFGFAPGVTATRDGARVQSTELTPELTLLAQFEQRPLWLGLRAGFALSFVEAQGFTPQGLDRDGSARIPALRFGVDVELPVLAGFSVALAIELEARLLRQRFAVNEEEVADLGQLRPLARLSVLFAP